VVDGRVRVRGGEHGDEVVGAEQTIGLLSLLARDDEGLDAVAETDTLTLALRADDLFDVFEDDFGVLYDQIRDLARQTLLLRRRIPEGTYLAPEGNAGDLPTGDVDLVQRLLFMRRGALRNANMDALLAMAQRMPTARFASGTTLWQVGAPSGFMYVILSGRVHCTTEDGTRFVCGPGYPLGNLESQCGASRWYQAVTDTPVTALLNETDAFLDTIEQHFEMALDFVATMASGLIARRAEMREEPVPAVVASEE
jgi:CRP-like cAMP-binding protein